jgi:D-galacturonate reductase
MATSDSSQQLRAGMVGMGMIFDETYRPFFERTHRERLYDRQFGDVSVPLVAVATRTGSRAEAYRKSAGTAIHPFVSHSGDDAVAKMLAAGVDFACVATPDNRHFEAAKAILDAGAHVLIEKPSADAARVG